MDLNEHRRDGRERSGNKRQKFHKKIKFWNTPSSKQRLSVSSRNTLEWQQTNRNSPISYQRMTSENTGISVIICKKNVKKMCLKTALFSVVRPSLIWMAKSTSIKFAYDIFFLRVAAIQTKSTRSSSHLVLLMSRDRRSSRQFGGRRMLQSKIIWLADCSQRHRCIWVYLGCHSDTGMYQSGRSQFLVYSVLPTGYGVALGQTGGKR